MYNCENIQSYNCGTHNANQNHTIKLELLGVSILRIPVSSDVRLVPSALASYPRNECGSPSLVEVVSVFSTCLSQCSLIVCDFSLVGARRSWYKNPASLEKAKNERRGWETEEKGETEECVWLAQVCSSSGSLLCFSWMCECYSHQRG